MSNENKQPDERAAFEAWAKTKNMDLTPFETTFNSDFTSNAWDGWQARATAPQATATLTDEQIAAVWLRTTGFNECDVGQDVIGFARALLAIRPTAPQATTPESTAEEIDATFRRNLDLRIQNLMVNDKNEITWMAVSCRGVISSLGSMVADLKDAVRYRWLRERAWYVDGATYALELRERWVHDAPPCDADEVEQALDLALIGGHDANP